MKIRLYQDEDGYVLTKSDVKDIREEEDMQIKEAVEEMITNDEAFAEFLSTIDFTAMEILRMSDEEKTELFTRFHNWCSVCATADYFRHTIEEFEIEISDEDIIEK